MNVREFVRNLLDRLSIPILHYPQGNPYGQRAWPELGWRSLYRHMYRRQNMWSDLADKQFESEQHACLLQFSGLAEGLFSEQYGRLVEKQKRIIELKAHKDQYMEVLSDISKDLLSVEEVGVGITPQSLDSARQRVQAEIEQLAKQRQEVLQSLAETITSTEASNESDTNQVEELGSRLAFLLNQLARFTFGLLARIIS